MLSDLLWRKCNSGTEVPFHPTHLVHVSYPVQLRRNGALADFQKMLRWLSRSFDQVHCILHSR